MPLSQEQKDSIIQALQARNAAPPCEICGQGPLSLVEEIAQVRLAPAGNMLGGPTLPAAALVCTRCGNVRFHALGALGLMPLGQRNG